MRFQPSVYSTYGQDDTSIPGALDAQPAQKTPPDPAQIGQYVDLGVGAVKSLFGLSDEYMTVAEIEGQIEVAKKKKAANAFPGAWYWDDRIIKLTAKLGAAEERKGEEQAREVLWTIVYGAGAVAAVFGAVFVARKALGK